MKTDSNLDTSLDEQLFFEQDDSVLTEIDSFLENSFLGFANELVSFDNKLLYEDIKELNLGDAREKLFLNYASEFLGIEVVYDKNKVEDFECDDIYLLDATKQYLADIGKYPLLDNTTFEKLYNEYLNGSVDAEKKIIEANLRLVPFVVKKFIGFGMPFLDLIHEGNFGLYKALKKYDKKRGSFSNSAVWWIRQSVSKALSDQSRNIRIPHAAYVDMYKYKRFLEKFLICFGRLPSDDEVLEELEITKASLEKFKVFMYDTYSLDSPIENHDDAALLGDVIVDEKVESFEDLVYRDMLSSWKDDVLAILSPSRRGVIERLYGLNNNSPMTLKAIGKEKGFSFQNIGSLKFKALDQLRESYTARRAHPVYDYEELTISDKLMEKYRRRDVQEIVFSASDELLLNDIEIAIVAYLFGAYDSPKEVRSAMELKFLSNYTEKEKLEIINVAIRKYVELYKEEKFCKNKNYVRK